MSHSVEGARSLPLCSEEQVDDAVACVREVATEFGFDRLRVSLLVSAASELAMNTLRHAQDGQLRAERTANGRGLTLVVLDRGGGIGDLETALEDGFTTREDGLGLGLGAVRRAVEQVSLSDRPGGGTRAAITSYLPMPREQVAVGCAGVVGGGGAVNRATSFVHEVFGDSLLFGVVGAMAVDLPREARDQGLVGFRDDALLSVEPETVVRKIQDEARRRSPDAALDICVGLLRPDRLRVVTGGDAQWMTSPSIRAAEIDGGRSVDGSFDIEIPVAGLRSVVCTTAGISVVDAGELLASARDPDFVAETLAYDHAPGAADGKVLVLRREVPS